MQKAFADRIRRLVSAARAKRDAESTGLLAAVIRVHRMQTWFQRRRGVAMARLACGPCRKERLFTIWTDGRYRCLACLYAGVRAGHDETAAMYGDPAAMAAFSAAWLAYVARIEAMEEPWTSPSASTLIRLNHLASPPPPVCTIGICGPCGGYRPFMRREDGDAGCISCLMQGRIVEIEIEVADDEVAA